MALLDGTILDTHFDNLTITSEIQTYWGKIKQDSGTKHLIKKLMMSVQPL